MCLDIDQKPDVDGFGNLMDSWNDIPETFQYSTQSGGTHMIYATDRDDLGPASNYRNIKGVDRRGGSSFFVWWGDALPVTRDQFSEAPEWLLDPVRTRTNRKYAGNTEDWLDSLTDGEPNVLVRRAMRKITDDLGHSDMVSLQYEAIRLGAEGNPGIPEFLSTLEEAWLNRPPENHTTPESLWQAKIDEALDRGVAEFGDAIELLKNLEPPNYDNLPSSVSASLLIGDTESNKAAWTKALRALVKGVEDDQAVVSYLWFSPRTKPLSREWGIQFVAQRVESERAKLKPNEFHDPVIPKTTPTQRKPLLEDYEQEVVNSVTTFPKLFLRIGKKGGFINEAIAKPAAWNVLSMTFAFRAFIPVTPTDKLGVNLWFINLAGSGTGKSRAIQMERTILNALFEGDHEEAGYSVSAETSPAGLHEMLLRRDRYPTLFAADEASGFFKKLARADYMSGLENAMSEYYDGRVPPGAKMSLKELRGKSAMTSFHMSLHSTPEGFWEELTLDQLFSGFLARVNWTFGPKRERNIDYLTLAQDASGPVEFDTLHPDIEYLAVSLATMRDAYGGSPIPILATDEALARMNVALREMMSQTWRHDPTEVMEKSTTRLGYETMRKCAALNALWRGSRVIEMVDAWVAVDACQSWFDNLFEVMDKIGDSAFGRDCMTISVYIRSRSEVTRRHILSKFRYMIQRSSRELDDRLDYLRESGEIAQQAEAGEVTYYAI